MKYQTALFLVGAAMVGIGCARVSLQGSEKPIKVDISMRLDVYQHVEKDADSIENIVSGGKDKQSFLNLFVSVAYAQEEMSPEVHDAALRRKDRRATLLGGSRKAWWGK